MPGDALGERSPLVHVDSRVGRGTDRTPPQFDETDLVLVLVQTNTIEPEASRKVRIPPTTLLLDARSETPGYRSISGESRSPFFYSNGFLEASYLEIS